MSILEVNGCLSYHEWVAGLQQIVSSSTIYMTLSNWESCQSPSYDIISRTIPIKEALSYGSLYKIDERFFLSMKQNKK